MFKIKQYLPNQGNIHEDSRSSVNLLLLLSTASG
jgi:hypothetical protein